MISMATLYMILKNGGMLTKAIVSRMLLIPEHYTWYQIEAKTQAVLPVLKYVNHLIFIIMIINESMKNELKYHKTP